jgi:predicted enzyme related to lactoylglutathione lyase
VRSDAELAYVIHVVADVEAAVSFYERALGLRRDHVDADGSYGEVVAASEVRLGFAADWHADAAVVMRPDAPSAAVALQFLVDDVDRAYARALTTGASPITPPQEFPWGRMARFRDPNGFLVEVCARARHVRAEEVAGGSSMT